MAGQGSFLGDVNSRRVLHVGGAILLVVLVSLFVVASVPQLAGAEESYVVLSDSMSPSIGAGAVVFVSDVPADEIGTGDVITYRRATEGEARTITHRVVDVQTTGDSRSFVTKGDANEDPDPQPVSAGAVVGRVSFHIPLMGYIVSFAHSTLGLVTLVIIPAAVLVVLEVRDLWRATSDDGEGPLE